MTAPVLVLGAHRSGTSALNRVLGSLGLFTGARRDPNDEAWFFLRLNEWLLRQTGARWDTPEPFAHLLAHDDIRQLAVDYLRRSIDSPRSLGFLGLGRYLRHGGISGLRRPWGFKDPRTTFTLPLWLEVMPQAKVIHIHRHGVDVAASLRARQLQNLERSKRLYRRNRRLLDWLPKQAGFTDSVRCATLDGAFEVWEAYVRQARQHTERLGEQAFTLSYEDLTRDPQTAVAAVASFCDLQPSVVQLTAATALLRSDRAGAHREDAELSAFAARVADREAAAWQPAARPVLVRP